MQVYRVTWTSQLVPTYLQDIDIAMFRHYRINRYRIEVEIAISAHPYF